MQKTNAIRMLEKAKIEFGTIEYKVDPDLSGVHIADTIGQSVEKVFKTLVTKGDKTGYCVFCIPCDKELDLKKAARLTGDKKIEFLHVKDLLPVTGYIRGGCSPIGMKKHFPTYINSTAFNYDEIMVSGGVRGLQIVISPKVLAEFVNATCADLIK